MSGVFGIGKGLDQEHLFGLSDERGTYLWGVGLAQKFNEIRHDEIMAPGRYRALFNAEQGADDPGPWTMRLIHPQ